MKKIILLILIPFVFLSSESGKIKKAAEASDKKKNSLKESSESESVRKEKSILLKQLGSEGDETVRLFMGTEEIPEKMEFLEEKEGEYILGVNKNGISKIIYKKTDKEYSSLLYDGKGKRAGEVYFRILPNGWEVMRKSETGFEKKVYNTKGYEILKETYGADGKLKADESGVSAWKYEYNEKGKILSEEKFDAKGRPKAGNDGITRISYKYDKIGNILSEEKFDAGGRPKAGSDGITGTLYKYNEKGSETLRETFGTDGKLKANQSGSARSVSKYDENGRLEMLENYGEDGRLKGVISGIARVAVQYDAKGNTILEETFGEDGKLKANNQGTARTIRKYNDRGDKLLSEELVYGEDGKLISKTAAKYDEKGNPSEIEIFGADGKYSADRRGVSRYVYKYDENCIDLKKESLACISLKEYYDKDGRLMAHDYVRARTVNKFDKNANIIETEFYGADGKFEKNKVARAVYKFSDKGVLILEENYGSDGRLIDGYDGARKIYQYDENCLRSGGHTSLCRTLVENQGADGNLAGDFYGIGRTVFAFDDNCIRIKKIGNECYSKIEYFGADGKPKERIGSAKELNTYDANGNCILQEFYGKDGKLKEGESRITVKYDTKGYKISSTLSDSEGSVVSKDFSPVFIHPSFPDKVFLLELDEYFLLNTVKLEDMKKN